MGEGKFRRLRRLRGYTGTRAHVPHGKAGESGVTGGRLPVGVRGANGGEWPCLAWERGTGYSLAHESHGKLWSRGLDAGRCATVSGSVADDVAGRQARRVALVR